LQTNYRRWGTTSTEKSASTVEALEKDPQINRKGQETATTNKSAIEAKVPGKLDSVDTAVYPVKLDNESGARNDFQSHLVGTPHSFWHKFRLYRGRYMTNKQWFTGKFDCLHVRLS
jgi:hypothetical protein